MIKRGFALNGPYGKGPFLRGIHTPPQGHSRQPIGADKADFLLWLWPLHCVELLRTLIMYIYTQKTVFYCRLVLVRAMYFLYTSSSYSTRSVRDSVF